MRSLKNLKDEGENVARPNDSTGSRYAMTVCSTLEVK